MNPQALQMAQMVVGAAAVVGGAMLGAWGLIRRQLDRNRAAERGTEFLYDAQHATRCRITFDEERLVLTDCGSPEDEVLEMRWPEISRVTASKRDNSDGDYICLRFTSAEGGNLELDEEMDGWTELGEALHAHLPGSTPFYDWICAVAVAETVPDPTEIYSRQLAH